MKVTTPQQVAGKTGSKYLGVLVAAKFARELNAIPREAVPAAAEQKLTTRALETMTAGEIDFTLVKRRRKGD